MTDPLLLSENLRLQSELNHAQILLREWAWREQHWNAEIRKLTEEVAGLRLRLNSPPPPPCT